MDSTELARWRDPARRGRPEHFAAEVIAAARASGTGEVRLNVRDWRLRSAGLYERLGFTVLETEHGQAATVSLAM